MSEAQPADDEPITLAELAAALGKSVRSVQLDAKARLFPTWDDPIKRSGKVTSLAAVRRARDMAAAKAMAEFEQRQKLEGRRGRR